MRKIRIVSALAAVLAIASPEARPQAAINDQIRVGGEPMQLPGGLGNRPQFKTGTGRIRGRVVQGETGNPIRRAQVRLSGPEVGSRSATTDSEGRYEFTELPAGRFTISSTKSGFVSVNYGQLRPFEAGKTIQLTEGQTMDRADIAMPRGSVISGRLVDEFGDPVPDAIVSALRSTWTDGRRRLQPTGRTAQTNDLGQYRIYGLPPGEYYISANMTGTQMMQVEMAMAVSIAGRTAPGASQPSSGYAPTYYPGTTNGAEAQRVTLNLAQELNGQDFALTPVKLAKVSGTVLGSDGRPVPNTSVNLTPRSSDVTSPLMSIANSARTDANGNFTINSVAPGDYLLQTRGGTVFTTNEGGQTRTVFTMIGERGPGGEAEVGSTPVTVAGEDLSHVVLVTMKGGRAQGQITFEGAGKPENVANMRIMASPFDSDGPAMLGPGSGAVKADGSFELTGLAGGRIIRVANVPAGWTLKAVRMNGQDITDTGAEFKAGETVSGLDIVLTNKLTQVTGTVTDNGNQPVKDYTVVVFSDDPQRWTAPQTRWVAGVRPDQEGRYQLRNLPAGSYYIVAVEYIEQGTWGDPQTLERLKASATTLSIDEGEKKTMDLKISQ